MRFKEACEEEFGYETSKCEGKSVETSKFSLITRINCFYVSSYAWKNKETTPDIEIIENRRQAETKS